MTIFLSQNLSKYFNRLDWDKTMPIRASTKIPKFHRSQQGMLCRKLTNSTIEFKMFTIIMLHITRYTSWVHGSYNVNLPNINSVFSWIISWNHIDVKHTQEGSLPTTKYRHQSFSERKRRYADHLSFYNLNSLRVCAVKEAQCFFLITGMHFFLITGMMFRRETA